MLDGVDMNDAIDNLLPYQPSPDALAEVRVDTNNYSAEFGNVAGAVIGSTIKSGTNEFHGMLRVLARQQHGREFMGQQPGGAKKAELQQHVFGATLGGPIVRDKMFFFGDYEGFIRNRPFEQSRPWPPSRGGGAISRTWCSTGRVQMTPHRPTIPRKHDRPSRFST